MGAFEVVPAAGTVLSGESVSITVHFYAEESAFCEEKLAIFVPDLPEAPPPPPPGVEPDAVDAPAPVLYRLTGESCVPGINTWDHDLIFEEQMVVSQLPVFGEKGNCYAKHSNTFSFGYVIVGRQVATKVKIINPNKVACDVVVSAQLLSGGGKQARTRLPSPLKSWCLLARCRRERRGDRLEQQGEEAPQEGQGQEQQRQAEQHRRGAHGGGALAKR